VFSSFSPENIVYTICFTPSRRLLGFETSYEIDGFLKAHNVYEDYTVEDFERERQALKSPGL